MFGSANLHNKYKYMDINVFMQGIGSPAQQLKPQGLSDRFRKPLLKHPELKHPELKHSELRLK